VSDVVVQDKAGERILEELMIAAEQRLHEEGIRGTIHLFKNNTDFAGNSYGCHENYLTLRSADTDSYAATLIPFLVSRQIYAGAGHVLQTARGPLFTIAQRSEHVWESMSSATTRSRPIINTRDEPHADPEKYRRLHVIVGDSNMSEYTNFLKIGATSCLLMMIEAKGFSLPDFQLENPIRAIREISQDLTCRRTVRLANGREVSALDVQRSFLDRAHHYRDTVGFPDEEQRALEMWTDAVEKLEQGTDGLHTKIDWIIKLQLVDQFMSRHQCRMDDPRVQMLDLQYHDIRRDRGLYFKLQDRGLVTRVVTDQQIRAAMDDAPSTTRAHLRSKFIKRAKEKKRDYTVDWVHLKLNDQAQRTILCKDPFKSKDERVERLIESI
jgi:proteasome accessory factor A